MTGREWARAWWLAHRNDELRIEAALAEAWTAGNEDGYRAGAMVTGTALEAVQRAMGRSGDVKDVAMTSGRVHVPVDTTISVGAVPDYMKERRARDRDKGE